MNSYIPDINFTSFFMSDVADAPKLERDGRITLRKLTAKYDQLIIRLEDVILDMSYAVYMDKCIGNRLKDYNTFQRLQGIPFDTSYKFSSDIACIPVFYPMYQLLSTLINLEYPVVILHNNSLIVKRHPLFQLFELQGILKEALHYMSSDAKILSPYREDGPNYLFPRSFNIGVMDPMFVLKY